MDGNSTPLGAIHKINEALEPFQQLRSGEDVPAQLRLSTAFVMLTSELGNTKQILGQAERGHGLATLWWRRLVRECGALESAAKENPGDWGQLYFRRDDLFDWLRRDAQLVSVALTSMANGAINGPSVAGLLDDDPETGVLDRLRKLADDWEAEFADAPPEPHGGLVKQEFLDAWRPWGKRREALLADAGRRVLEAVNKNQIAAKHFKDDRFADVLLRQLVLDYSQPERGLIQRIDGANSPDGLRRLADWLADISEKDESNAIVRNSLSRCRERLVAAKAKHRALSVLLVHQDDLGNKPEPFWPDLSETCGMHQLNLGGGPQCDPQQLFDTNGQPAVGEKPYLDVEGNPMVYTDGKPIAMYPGGSRTCSLYGRQFPDSNEFVYSEAVVEYDDIAAALGRLLKKLPATVKEVVWNNWPHGFVEPQPKCLWTNAIFELAWQQHANSDLFAKRWAWHVNTKLDINDLARVQHSDGTVFDMFRPLIERVDYPPSYWYSWLANIWQASMDAVDLLLTLLPQGFSEEAGSESLPPAVESTAQQAGGDAGASDSEPIAAKKMTVARANDKAMKLAKQDPDFVKKVQREWAGAIGCSVGLIGKTAFWQETMNRTDRGRKEICRKPKKVSMTKAVEESVGEGTKHDVLEKLIAEQESDYEPSPLDSKGRNPISRDDG